MIKKCSYLITISLSLLIVSSRINSLASQEVNLKEQKVSIFLSKNHQESSFDINLSSWRLVTYLDSENQVSLPYSQHEPILKFKSGQLSGNSGCNVFNSSYNLKKENQISINPIATSLRACGFKGLSRQERDYLDNLAKVTSYELKNEQIAFKDPQGETRLTFQRIKPASFVENLWKLENYNNGRNALVSPISDSNITLRATIDGQINGFAGCNTYRGSWEENNEEFILSPLATTRKLCNSPQNIMEQETAFLKAIGQVVSHDIHDTTLIFKDAEGKKLAQFRAVIARD